MAAVAGNGRSESNSNPGLGAKTQGKGMNSTILLLGMGK